MPLAAVRLAVTLLASLLCAATAAIAQEGEWRPSAVVSLRDWGTGLAFDPAGGRLAIGTYEKVLLWDRDGQQASGELAIGGGYARGVAWSPDGELLAVGCYRAVEVWSAPRRERVQSWPVRGYVQDVEFSPDGAFLAAACETGHIRRWRVSDGQELEPWKHADPATSVAWSPDGALLASTAGDDTRLSRPGDVRLWNLADGSHPVELLAPEKCANDAVFSLEGSRLLVADLHERVTVYDIANGEALGFFGKHARPVNSVVSAGRGELAVSGAGGRFQSQNTVKIWRLADGEELATIDHHEAKVTRVALSRDQHWLATTSYDKTAALWDVSAILSSAAAAPSDSTTAAQPAPPADPAPDENAPTDPAPADAAPGAFAAAARAALDQPAPAAEPGLLRIGIIGLDTSHATAFTQMLNAESPAEVFRGVRVVAAYPHGSRDIESSVKRIPEYTETVQKLGVEVVDSIDALLERVDCVLLETNDGRPHLEQAWQVLKARKPVFIDKPLAGSLADCVAIFDAAEHWKTPVFSSSSLRYLDRAQKLRQGELGRVLGCDAYSPCHLEATHPSLYWYGIHGVETLYTLMGPGCERVTRSSTPDFDVAVGVWSDGRIGTFRGIRAGGSGYGGTAFCEQGVQTLGEFQGYEPLLVKIVEFFRTGEPPVSAAETIELYAFMEAADESRRAQGAPVSIADVLAAARETAKRRLAELPR